MKKNKKGAIMLSMVLAASTILSGNVSAAVKNPVKDLEPNKVYSYDVDKDGTKDKVKYTFNEKDSAIRIYINDKLAKKVQLDKETGFYDGRMQIADIDKSDKTMDFWVYGFAFSDDICFSALYELKGNKLTKIFENKYKEVNENFSLSQGTLYSTDGKGNFDVQMDRAFFCDYITGNHWDRIPYQLKNGKVVRKDASYYQFAATYTMDGKGKYIAAKKLAFTKKPGGKETSFTLKKGGKVTALQLYAKKNGELFVQYKNADGKKGWLAVKDYSFENQPFTNSLFAG